ncbi:MAG: hypothetical protein M3R52_00655 [Acidobacteriota bacterium]|nr:hypothetical protein [Acidobacteriota bacterium]
MKIELIGKWFVPVTITAALLVASCGQTQKQKSPAQDAIKALRKLEASTQVHPSYTQYSGLVIDAKSEVNEVARVLPDGELKSHLNGAIDSYADAATAWSVMGETLNGSQLSNRDEPGKTLSKKYDIDLDPVKVTMQEYDDSLKRIGNPNYESPAKRATLDKIWSVAKNHLDRASALVERD